MSPQVQAYCATVRQLAMLANAEANRDRDAVMSQFEELSDMARTIARFGTDQVREEFYDLLTTEPDVATHAAPHILQHFQPSQEIRDRAVRLMVANVRKTGILD